MIRLVRGPEPSALGPLREKQLAAARKAAGAGTKIDFSGYSVVKTELFDAQHHKCCYCEKLEEQAKYRDVEHYRPKAYYWWLAWTWDNLLFGCIDCNREHKRDQFPLTMGSIRLTNEEVPPGSEHPLVINPFDPAIDPMEEIEFRRDKIQGKERWRPYGLTERGNETIEVCGLARDGLLTLYTDHVTHVVRPKLGRIFLALETGDARGVLHAWATTTRGLLHPARPFRALSHDALAVLVPQALRERYNLRLQRPA